MSDDKHMNHWRAIACRYLDAQYGDPNFRGLSGQIMMKLVQQSLAAIQTDGPGSTVKATTSKQGKNQINAASIAVQTVEDLRLVVEVYQRQNRWIDAAALMDEGCNTGLRSQIARGNWQLVTEKIEIMVSIAKYGEMWRLCYQLLCDAAGIGSKQPNSSPYSYGKTGDDMAVWKGAVLSCYEIGDSALIEKMKDLLENPKLIKRHRLLSAIDLSVKFNPTNATIPSPVNFATAVGNYLEAFGGSEVAYSDLRVFAVKLTKTQIDELIDQSTLHRKKRPTYVEIDEQSSRSYVILGLTDLKLRYSFIFANPDHDISTDLMGNFAADSLELYSLALTLEDDHASTDRGWGDEAAILAACALLQMHRQGVEGAQLQATLVLEKLLENSKHHYGAILLLIRLYVRQGVWSQAYKYYQRLDLKNIQYFTEAWILLNRAGSIFPYSKRVPNEDLVSTLNHHASYAQSKETITYRLSDLYDEEQNYIGLCGVHEFLALCHESISKAANLAELSRLGYRNVNKLISRKDSPLGRVLNIQPDGHYEGMYHELRSTRALPTYEIMPAMPIEQVANLGPHTDHLWIQCEDLMHRWRHYARDRFWPTLALEDYENLASQMHGTSNAFNKFIIAKKEADGMTKTETLVGWILRTMTAVQEFYCATELAAKSGVDTVEKADQWVTRYLRGYQSHWEHCAKSVNASNDILIQKAKDFEAEAISIFDQSQWQTLHDYFKVSELWMVYPWFIHNMILNATILRDFARKTSLSLNELDCLNILKLAQHLKTYLNTQEEMIIRYNKGARLISEHWQGKEYLARLTVGACGRDSQISRLREAMEKLIEKDWAQEKCVDIVHGWRDAVAGIELENAEFWFTKHWQNLDQYL